MSSNPTFRTVFSIICAASIAGACGGDPTGTDSGDPLSDAEVQAVLTELAQSLGNLAAVPSVMRPGIDRPVVLAESADPISIDFNESAPCEAGSIGIRGSIDGDIDEQTLTGSFDARITWTIDGCVITVEGTAVTVDDDPNIVFDAEFTLGENSISATGTEKGGFRYTAADGRSG